MRTYHSRNHIRAAAYFTRLAASLEESTNFPRIGFVEHRGCVTAAVLSSVAFLEATVNEVLGDAADGVGRLGEELPPGVVSSIRALARIGGVDRLPVLALLREIVI
jgi:hypothetical protein